MSRLLLPALLALAILGCSSSDESAVAAPENNPNDPDRWESAIQAFEQADAENSPEPGGVVFIGSSSVRRWDLEKSFPGKGYVNRGFGGSQMSDAVRYVDRILAERSPDTIVLYEGDNDIGRGKSPDTVVADFEAFVRKSRDRLPEVRIIFIAVKPSLSRWDKIDLVRDVNSRIRTMADDDPLLVFADIDTPMIGPDGEPRPELYVEDGLHLTEEGYAVWTGVIGPLIEQ